MATILYARVSSAEQTIDHQLAHTKAAGFTIDEGAADNRASGLHSRLVERPEGRRGAKATAISCPPLSFRPSSRNMACGKSRRAFDSGCSTCRHSILRRAVSTPSWQPD